MPWRSFSQGGGGSATPQKVTVLPPTVSRRTIMVPSTEVSMPMRSIMRNIVGQVPMRLW